MSINSVRVILAALATASCMAGIGATAARAANGDIINLGTLPDGHPTNGHAINSSGQVAGNTIDPIISYAFRYDLLSNAMLQLDSPFGGINMLANGINDSGQVVGRSWVGGNYHAYRYDGTAGAGGQMFDLGTLGGSNSIAFGINTSGQITGQSDVIGGYGHAFRYDDSTGMWAMHSLGLLPGGLYSTGRGINDAGQVVGEGSITGGARHAFRYDYDTTSNQWEMRDLGTLAGWTNSYGRGINASGQVTGYLDGGTSISHAFRYDGMPGEDGRMIDLGVFIDGSNSSGYGINDEGFVVGWADHQTVAGYVATLWRPDGSIVDLNAWLDSVNPAEGANWFLSRAYDMNNSGLITGWGLYDDGTTRGTRAFILDASSFVPEPTSFAILAISAAGLLLRRRNQKRDH